MSVPSVAQHTTTTDNIDALKVESLNEEQMKKNLLVNKFVAMRKQ